MSQSNKLRYPTIGFDSAHTEATSHAQHDLPVNWKAFELAFTDKDFLLREELRSVRLQLEALKPELIQQDQQIDSTVVFFGSARIPEPSIAKKRLHIIQKRVKKNPQNTFLQRELIIAENIYHKSHYYQESQQLAKIISTAHLKDPQKFNFVVMTGGGPGVMEAANRGAYEARAKSIALNILLPQEQVPNPYVTPELCFQFHYFAMRKMHFLLRAQAIVVFPGGFGTLDELFETLTLLQTNKMKSIPLLLFGKDYWQKIVNFESLVTEGVISPEDLQLFNYVEKAEEAWQIISNFYS